jgi:hypothetical protein
MAVFRPAAPDTSPDVVFTGLASLVRRATHTAATAAAVQLFIPISYRGQFRGTLTT